MRHLRKLPLLLFFLTLFGCGGEDRSTEGTEVAELNVAYTVQAGGVDGLHLGDPLADHGDRLEPGTLETGEGTFEVYYLRGRDGEELGYVMPSVGDAERVGDVTITSPVVATESGIRVGDPLSKLLIAHPDLSVSGSEVESRTYAFTEALAFRLDSTSAPGGWRILEIIVPDAKRGDTLGI